MRRVEIWITICLTNFSHRTLCKWKYKWLVVFETKIDAVGDKWEWLTEWLWKSTHISNSGVIIWSCKVYSLHKGPFLLIQYTMCFIKLILTVWSVRNGCYYQGMISDKRLFKSWTEIQIIVEKRPIYILVFDNLLKTLTTKDLFCIFSVRLLTY